MFLGLFPKIVRLRPKEEDKFFWRKVLTKSVSELYTIKVGDIVTPTQNGVNSWRCLGKKGHLRFKVLSTGQRNEYRYLCLCLNPEWTMGHMAFEDDARDKRDECVNKHFYLGVGEVELVQNLTEEDLW
jgi:hypothetical protein